MKTLSGKSISPIGIGTYGVGGRGHRDMPITEKASDDIYINALVHYLDKGANFTEVALGYGHSHSLTLFKEAFDKSCVEREDFFLTHSLYPRDFVSMETVHQDTTTFYEVMDTDYADSTLVTQSLIMRFGGESVYPFLHNLLNTGKSRYVSLSNANPEFIKSFKEEFGNAFVAHEGHLSFEVRALQEKGIFDLCNKMEIMNIIWRPLRRNKTLQYNWPLLVELAGRYGKTQSQVVLNWMCHVGYHPMVFSTSKAHIDENIASPHFVMSDEDYEQMTNFRPPHYSPPEIAWDTEKIDDSIVTLANEFESHIVI